MKSINLTLMVTLLIVSACKQQAPLTDADRVAVTAQVKNLLDATSDSVRAHGFNGWVPFLDNSSQFTWQATDKRPSDYGEMIKDITTLNPKYRSISITWDSVVVKPVSLNEAEISAKYSETLVDTLGQSGPINGIFEAKVINTEKLWKYRSVHTH